MQIWTACQGRLTPRLWQRPSVGALTIISGHAQHGLAGRRPKNNNETRKLGKLPQCVMDWCNTLISFGLRDICARRLLWFLLMIPRKYFKQLKG